MNKKIKILLLICLASKLGFSQEPSLFGRRKEIRKERWRSIYLDTLTRDTIYENYKIGQRIIISNTGIELSRGSLNGGLGAKCGCEVQPNGYWIKRYRNGNLKETGEYDCNMKVGTWTYFYENGNIWKVETYQAPYLEFLTEHEESWDTLKNTVYLLSGAYAEYYSNGKPKVEGRYEIIEECRSTDTLVTALDPDTYEEIKTVVNGRFWRPKSVKTGFWKEMDEKGNLVKEEKFSPIWEENKKYRPIASRYYELFFDQKK